MVSSAHEDEETVPKRTLPIEYTNDVNSPPSHTKRTYSKDDLSLSTDEKIENDQTDDEQKRFYTFLFQNHKCRPCGRILLTQKNLVQHINSLKCRGEIRCATCSAKMKSEEELIAHNNEEHDPRNKSRNLSSTF